MREVAARDFPDRGIECGHRICDIADEEGDDSAEDEEGNQADKPNHDGDVRHCGKCLVVGDAHDNRPARCADRLRGEVHLRSFEFALKHLFLARHETRGEILVFAAVQFCDRRPLELVIAMVDELPLGTEDEYRAGLADLDLVKEVHDLGE